MIREDEEGLKMTRKHLSAWLLLLVIALTLLPMAVAYADLR